MKTFLVLLSTVLLCGAAGFAQDSDRDGIPDKLDRMPHTAGFYMADQGEPMALSATADSDGDGVPDNLDPQPHTAGYYMAGAVMSPEVTATTDSDGDGRVNNMDTQPHTAGFYMASPMAEMEVTETADSDGDGRPDVRDKAPHVAWYYSAWVPPPPPPPDTDGDGVIDDLDKCPGTPAGVKVDANGCPIDTDGDGVADYLDKCPGTPAGVKVDATGCALDTDGDGVADHMDKCPGTPSGVMVDASGCALDTDGDGVADYLDKCPGTPKGIPVDPTGCPQIIKKGEKIVLDVKFALNSAEIQPESFEILQGVATTMIDFPDIKVAIRGFTDNTGEEAHNMNLSDRRAKSVKAFLQAEGVAADRMTAKGFGEDPQYFVADNATAEGRAQNRRVEIESVE